MDKDYLFVGLHFENEKNTAIKNILMDNFMDYIDFKKCAEQDLTSGFESDSHCTLLYTEEYAVDLKALIYKLLLDNQGSVRTLLTDELTFEKFEINTFDNEDSRVLKLDLRYCSLYPKMKYYHDLLVRLSKADDKYGEYKPHLTFTYLRSDTPNAVIDAIRNSLTANLLQYQAKYIKVSNGVFNFKIDN